MGVNTDILVRLTAEAFGANDNGSVTADIELEQLLQLASGTSADQSDLIFSDQRTLAASANETLDLTSGLTDPFGGALVFANITAILVVADPGNTNDVVVGNAGSNPFTGPLGGTTPTYAVKPGQVWLATAKHAPWAVDGTHKAVKIANGSSGTPVTYKLVILGRSA